MRFKIQSENNLEGKPLNDRAVTKDRGEWFVDIASLNDVKLLVKMGGTITDNLVTMPDTYTVMEE